MNLCGGWLNRRARKDNLTFKADHLRFNAIQSMMYCKPQPVATNWGVLVGKTMLSIVNCHLIFGKIEGKRKTTSMVL